MMWEAIGYVSSALTLIAFLAAVAAHIFKITALRQERLIKTAPEDDRAELVRNALEFFHVDTPTLTKAQQYELALEQIRTRAERFNTTAIVIVILTLILASLSAYAIYQSSDTSADPLANPFLSDLSTSQPSSYTRTNQTGSAVQLFEKGWMVADFQGNYFYAISKENPTKWRKLKEAYVKGKDPNCDTPPADSHLRLGFCWFYQFPEIQVLLGNPIIYETRAWVQYQEFGDDLLIYGAPTTKPGVESGTFQTLAAIYLTDERTSAAGSGRYKLVNESTVDGNPYCSANWYAARKDQGLPETLRQLVASGQCQRAIGTDEFIGRQRMIRLL